MENAVLTIGSCAMLGTPNTMACLSEMMGMSLSGTSTVHVVLVRQLEQYDTVLK